MKEEEFIKANNILEKLDFFNQRSARELWGNKPFDVQAQDIADRRKDIEYLKSFIEFQNKEIKKLKQLLAFDECCFQVYDSGVCYNMDCFRSGDIEIIGNEFDNPELLKGDTK